MVISAADSSGTCMPAVSHSAWYTFASPAPDSTRSADTRPYFLRSQRSSSIERSLVGAKLAWPPSVASTVKTPALATTPPTPRPVPTPTMAQTPCVNGNDSRCGPDRLQVRGAQRADRVPDGFEVVDDVQVLEVLGFAQRPRRK